MPEKSDVEINRAREILERAMKRVSEFETLKGNAGLYCILCMASFSKTIAQVADDDVIMTDETIARAISYYAEQLSDMLKKDFARRRVEIEQARKH
jgi:hypothetical protein